MCGFDAVKRTREMASTSGESPCLGCHVDKTPQKPQEGNDLCSATPLEQLGGYDCEFVERPQELQKECPICLIILREPFQVTCCGYSFC